MPPIIGIDLGTTNSLCAIFENGAPRLIPNGLNEALTPSVVGITDDGQILVGAAAKELRITQPSRCAACFKRFMGSNESLTIAGQKFTPVELSSLVLKSLREDARHYLRADVTDAVITVPAYFNDHQRQATKQAGELAGLRVRRIVNEPTAAALTYGFHDRQAEKRILVIDLGGGTFDVTLMDVFEGTLEIVSTAGESFLGGEDFTDRLMANLLQKQGLQLEIAELNQPLRVARLRQQCEVAKRQLTSADVVSLKLPDEAGQIAPDAPAVNVSRDGYDKLVEPLVERLKRPVAKTLRDGRAAPNDIVDVILVGGATRMPVVQQFIREFFHQEPLCTFNPDEVVALGASVQAALIADDRAVEDLVMTDVCPFTLGIEVSKEFTGELKAGYFVPIIHRNTTIPVSKEQIFQTIAPNQREVNVVVYQGEHRRVEQNFKIGELKVTGIPPGPAGKRFYVRFTYDLNGILEVEAYLPESSHKFRTVLTQHARSLDRDELAEAVQKLQALKYYPREDLFIQRLMC
jgi:molecular chaperone HscC